MGGQGVSGRGRVGGGGQVGCERRIEVFVKIQKKKIFFLGGGGSGGGGGSVAEGVRWGWGWWGGGQDGCERNVGGRGDVGYGGCEPRIEGIVQCTKRYCTILRKRKNVGWGEGEGAIFEPKTLFMYLKKEKEKKK